MSILNRPTDGLLSVLIALRRTLLAYGPLDGERLLALAAPPSVAESSQQARQTLRRWTQLGLFVDIAGTFNIAPPFDKIESHDTHGLRRAMTQLVLADANNPDFDVMSDAPERPLATDFTRAVCWALAQDVYALDPVHASIEALQNAQQLRPMPFVNDTRWQGFMEWSAFLGFSRRAPQLLIEPHFAVSSVLDEVFGPDDSLPVTAFVGRVAAALPVLDGGRYRTHVEGTTKTPPYVRRDGDISISLSAALLHLEASQLLRLEARSDAPTRQLLGHRAREIGIVSHITRGDRHE